MVPGGRGPSEGSLNERAEEEKEKEEREEEEGEEEAIESMESGTACSLWEQKSKTKVLCLPLGGIVLLGVHSERSVEEESMHVHGRCVRR